MMILLILSLLIILASFYFKGRFDNYLNFGLLSMFLVSINIYSSNINISVLLTLLSMVFLFLRRCISLSEAMLSIIFMSFYGFGVPLTIILPIIFVLLSIEDLRGVSLIKRIIPLVGLFCVIFNSVVLLLVFIVLTLIFKKDDEIEKFVVSLLILTFDGSISFNFYYALPIVMLVYIPTFTLFNNIKNKDIQIFILSVLVLMISSDLSKISLISTIYIFSCIFADCMNGLIIYFNKQFSELQQKAIGSVFSVSVVLISTFSMMNTYDYCNFFILTILAISFLKFIKVNVFNTKEKSTSVIALILSFILIITPVREGFALMGISKLFIFDISYFGYYQAFTYFLIISLFLLFSKYTSEHDYIRSVCFKINSNSFYNGNFIQDQVNEFLSLTATKNITYKKERNNRIYFDYINTENVILVLFILFIFLGVLKEI